MTNGLMKRSDIHIKFAAAWDAKCDNCNKRSGVLHQVKTPYWTKYFCDKCANWFVIRVMPEEGESEKEVQHEFEVENAV